MTTPNKIMPGMMPAGVQEITSGRTKGEVKEDQSFMDVLNIADSASKARAPEQRSGSEAVRQDPKQTKVSNEVRDNNDSAPEDVNRDLSKEAGEDVSGTAKTKDDKAVQDTSKNDGRIDAAVEDVKAAVEEKLEISDEELIQVMETLGLTNADLLDPRAMPEIVAEVKDVAPVDMLTDSELTGIVTDLQSSVREITSDLIQEMDITPEEFKNTLAQLKNEYEVIPTEPGTEVTRTEETRTADFGEVIADTADDQGRSVKADGTETHEKISPERDTVRTPAEAVAVPRKEEALQDRTERISEEQKGGNDEVSLNVTVKTEQDQNAGTGNGQEDPSGDIQRSEGRARHTEARAETAHNNNSIFIQNLTNAVENTLEAAAVNESAAPGSAMPDAMDLIRQINSQIRAVIDSETQSLSMQLHPQSLGRLNVELVSKAGQLTAQFEAENESVRAALETRIVELKEALEQRGVRVESVEVTVASHEFEQNLMGGEQSGNASQGSGGSGRNRTRSINLNDTDIEGIDGEDISEDERIARDMMAANGNSVDYMA